MFILREKFVSMIGFEPQISSFTYWRSTIEPFETPIPTNLSLIHISIQDSHNVIQVFNSKS